MRPTLALLLILAGCGGAAPFGLMVCDASGECVDHGATDPAAALDGFALLSVSVCSGAPHEAKALVDGEATGVATPITSGTCAGTVIEWDEVVPRGDIQVLATPSTSDQRFTVTVATGGVARWPEIETVLAAEGELARLHVYATD